MAREACRQHFVTRGSSSNARAPVSTLVCFNALGFDHTNCAREEAYNKVTKRSLEKFMEHCTVHMKVAKNNHANYDNTTRVT